jgi:hypothetical protein
MYKAGREHGLHQSASLFSHQQQYPSLQSLTYIPLNPSRCGPPPPPRSSSSCWAPPRPHACPRPSRHPSAPTTTACAPYVTAMHMLECLSANTSRSSPAASRTALLAPTARPSSRRLSPLRLTPKPSGRPSPPPRRRPPAPASRPSPFSPRRLSSRLSTSPRPSPPPSPAPRSSSVK